MLRAVDESAHLLGYHVKAARQVRDLSARLTALRDAAATGRDAVALIQRVAADLRAQ